MSKEIQKLLSEGMIEESISSWWVQLVMLKDPTNHKKKECVDYSQTINLYAELDAYHLPRIDKMINNLAILDFFFIWPQKHLPPGATKSIW